MFWSNRKNPVYIRFIMDTDQLLACRERCRIKFCRRIKFITLKCSLNDLNARWLPRMHFSGIMQNTILVMNDRNGHISSDTLMESRIDNRTASAAIVPIVSSDATKSPVEIQNRISPSNRVKMGDMARAIPAMAIFDILFNSSLVNFAFVKTAASVV